MPASSDRNLLYDILALQMDFITREQLVAGMQAWVLAKEISLAEHLVREGALRPEHRQLLEPLVEAHIRQHGDDPQQCLASISSFDALRSELAGLRDEQIDASTPDPLRFTKGSCRRSRTTALTFLRSRLDFACRHSSLQGQAPSHWHAAQAVPAPKGPSTAPAKAAPSQRSDCRRGKVSSARDFENSSL